MNIVPLRERIAMDKFLKAEEIRLQKAKRLDEIKRARLSPILKLEKSTFIVNFLERSLIDAKYDRDSKNLLNNVRKSYEKVRESNIMRKKVLKESLKQQLKLIRRGKSENNRKSEWVLNNLDSDTLDQIKTKNIMIASSKDNLPNKKLDLLGKLLKKVRFKH